MLFQLLAHTAGTWVSLVCMDDEGQRVDHVAGEHDIQFHQLGWLVTNELIVEGSIAAGAGFQRIEEVIDDFIQRQLIVQLHAVSIQIFGVFISASTLLTKLHDGADVGCRGQNVCFYIWFLSGNDGSRVRIVGWVVDMHDGTISQLQLVHNGRCGGDEVQIELTFQTFLNNFHVEQTQEAAAETEAQCFGGLCLEGEGRIVQLEFFQRITQVRVFCTVSRVHTGEYHWVYLAVARQSFYSRAGSVGNGITYAGICHIFNAGSDIAYFACLQFFCRNHGGRTHIAYFNNVELSAGCHHFDGHARSYGTFHHADINDNTLVAVIVGVEDQSLQRSFRVAGRGRNIGHDTFQHIFDVEAGFRGDLRCIQSRNTDDILDLMSNTFRVSGRQVDLIQNRNHFQIVFYSQIGVCQSLCFNTLRGINDQQGALTRRQRTGNLVVKVHVTWGIDEVELVIFAVFCFIIYFYCAGFDGNTALTFQLHIIQKLVFHLTKADGGGFLQNSVSQSGFTVVNMSNNRKIADMIQFIRHVCPP